MRRFEFNKLVRDKVFESMLDDGQKPEYRVLSSDLEYLEALKAKLLEEVGEFDISNAEASEIADIREALDALVDAAGIDWVEVDAERQKKLDKAGGFAGRIFVTVLALEDTDPWTVYYSDNPDRFPEIIEG